MNPRRSNEPGRSSGPSLEKLAAAILRESPNDVVMYLPAHIEQSLRARTLVAVQLHTEGTTPVSRQIVTALLSQVIGVAAAKSGLGGVNGKTGATEVAMRSLRAEPIDSMQLPPSPTPTSEPAAYGLSDLGETRIEGIILQSRIEKLLFL